MLYYLFAKFVQLISKQALSVFFDPDKTMHLLPFFTFSFTSVYSP